MANEMKEPYVFKDDDATVLFQHIDNNQLSEFQDYLSILEKKAQHLHQTISIDGLLPAPKGFFKRTHQTSTSLLYYAASKGKTDAVDWLINKGADANQARTNDGATPLFIAAQNDHTATVELLLERGADVNQACTDDGATPLFIAAQNDHTATVELLLANGAEVNQARTDNGATPLIVAAESGHTATVECLLERGADVNQACTDDGATPLFIAAQEDHTAIVELLLTRGADANQARTNDGATPLFIAAQNDHTAIVEHLLANGAEVNQARTDNGATPLYSAAKYGHLSVVKILLEAGADIDQALANNKKTPLMIAREKGHTEVVKWLTWDVDATVLFQYIDNNQLSEFQDYLSLIEKRAPYFKKKLDIDGLLPAPKGFYNYTQTSLMFYAASKGKTNIVNWLVQKGANVNQPCTENGGPTPLYMAANKGHLHVVESLLSTPEIEVNKARTNNGGTPLHSAAYRGHLAIVEKLLSAPKIDVNKACTSSGATALYVAAFYGNLAIVEKLLSAPKIDVNKACTDGATALYVAAQNGHLETAKRLLAAGASVSKAHMSGWTPLKIAAKNGHTEIVSWLLAVDATFDKTVIKVAANETIRNLLKAKQKEQQEAIKAARALATSAVAAKLHPDDVFDAQVQEMRTWLNGYTNPGWWKPKGTYSDSATTFIKTIASVTDLNDLANELKTEKNKINACCTIAKRSLSDSDYYMKLLLWEDEINKKLQQRACAQPTHVALAKVSDSIVTQGDSVKTVTPDVSTTLSAGALTEENPCYQGYPLLPSNSWFENPALSPLLATTTPADRAYNVAGAGGSDIEEIEADDKKETAVISQTPLYTTHSTGNNLLFFEAVSKSSTTTTQTTVTTITQKKKSTSEKTLPTTNDTVVPEVSTWPEVSKVKLVKSEEKKNPTQPSAEPAVQVKVPTLN